MSNTPNRVVIERVQWLEVLPILRLASAFRYALQPGKVIVALIAVMVLHGVGLTMDAIWGDVFESRPEPQGVYETFLEFQALALHSMFDASLQFDLGLGRAAAEQGVYGWVYAFLWDTPRFIVDQHPWFAVIYGLIALVVLMIAAGIICRMSATQICQAKLTSLAVATKFAVKRWLWYLLTPLLPFAFIILLALVLMLAGLVFFNLPGLDVIGSLIYGVMLLIGFVIALVGFVLVFSLVLMPPAMSVEGTDAFDAISRAFNYVMYKPWQFAGYLVGSLVYLAVLFLVLSMLLRFTESMTQWAVGSGAFSRAPETTILVTEQRVVLDKPTITRFEAITSDDDIQEAGKMVDTSSWIVHAWLKLLGAILIALMFSTFCSLQTQVYVLLRRAADDTPLDDCAADDDTKLWSSPEDMVDPAAQAIAATGPKGHPTPETSEAPESTETAEAEGSGRPDDETPDKPNEPAGG